MKKILSTTLALLLVLTTVAGAYHRVQRQPVRPGGCAL